MKTRSLLLVLALVGVPTSTFAQAAPDTAPDTAPAPTAPAAPAAPAAPRPATPEQLREAKTFYAAGVAAYERGDFDGAIQAFLEAHHKAPKPAVLFSLAQSFRRKYYVSKSTESLSHALRYYREYLSVDPNGPRAADSAQALAELGPAEERLLAEPTQGEGLRVVGSDRKTRVAISTPAKDAEIAIDDGAFEAAPLLREVTPGKHVVRVRGPGYLDEQRDVVAIEGSLVAFDIALRDKPATFVVEGEQGARVEIDGRLAMSEGQRSFSLSPGRHLIAVSRRGHEPYVREIVFARGETKKLQVSLRTTSRRRISTGFLIAGGAGLIGAGVLGAIAFERDAAAVDLRDARGNRALTPQDRNDYESARGARNDFALAAGVTLGASVVLGGLGLALHVFDDPARNAPRIDSDSAEPAPSPQPKPLELGFTPWTSRDGGGGGVWGRF